MIERFYAIKYNLEKLAFVFQGYVKHEWKGSATRSVHINKMDCDKDRGTKEGSKKCLSAKLSHLLVQSLCDQKTLWH